jgi:hypothetical protein
MRPSKKKPPKPSDTKAFSDSLPVAKLLGQSFHNAIWLSYIEIYKYINYLKKETATSNNPVVPRV